MPTHYYYYYYSYSYYYYYFYFCHLMQDLLNGSPAFVSRLTIGVYLEAHTLPLF